MDKPKKQEGPNFELEPKRSPEDRVEHSAAVESEVPSVEAKEPAEKSDSTNEKQEQKAEIVRRLEGEYAVTKPKKNVSEYVEKNLPAHLRKMNYLRAFATPVMGMVGEVLFNIEGRTVEGREHVPKNGPALLVANHTRDNDQFTIAALAKRPVDFAGADVHFRINPVVSWFLKKIGIYEVKSTLSNLSEEEKAELMERVPKRPGYVAKYYQDVAARPTGIGDVRKFAKETAALLARGDAVAIFPEGLWLYEGNILRKAYPGIELVNNEYKRLTGEDAPIVPIAISDKRVTVAEPMTLGEGENVHTIMQKIAEMMPEEERGYYD